MPMPQAKTLELSMCNQETVPIDRPIKCHVRFILSSSLTIHFPQRSRHFVNPTFRLMRFPLDGETRFVILFDENLIFRKKTWSRHLFFFIFKRVNKIRKKTLSTTPYFGKCDLRKTGSGSGVRLLIEKVR